MVVARDREAVVDLVDDLLTVDAEFQRRTQILIIERRIGDARDEAEAVACALGAHDIELLVLHQEIDGTRIEAVDRIDLAGLERCRTRGHVLNVADFDLFEIRAARLPVIATTLEDEANARLEALERITAGADRLLPVGEAIRNDNDVVIAQDDGEVGIAGLKRHGDLIVVDFLDF